MSFSAAHCDLADARARASKMQMLISTAEDSGRVCSDCHSESVLATTPAGRSILASHKRKLRLAHADMNRLQATIAEAGQTSSVAPMGTLFEIDDM